MLWGLAVTSQLLVRMSAAAFGHWVRWLAESPVLSEQLLNRLEL